MRQRVPFALLALLAACSAAAGTPAPSAVAPPALLLRFDRPATDWEREGLPIGNGAQGAMVTGELAHEHLQFNEKSLWTGGPGSHGYASGLPPASLAREVQALQAELDARGSLAPEAVAQRLGLKAQGYGDYQSAGEWLLDHELDEGAVRDYRRVLDLDSALASVSYSLAGVGYRREYIASAPGDVLGVRLVAEAPGHIDVSLRPALPANRSQHLRTRGNDLLVTGALADNGLRYALAAALRAQGGTVHALPGGGWQVRGAASRAGSLPANLQGVWNNSSTPPWNDDYHVNINLQMNYWLAESTNLPE
ncbi:MAG: hypothetical protein RL684_32, partial [Pseudomonadota bacterium]